MTERKHKLTDEDIRALIEMGNHPCSGVGMDEVLANLPSRQPKDPDAGLGKLPWERDECGDVQANGQWLTSWAAQGNVRDRIVKAGLEPEVILCAIQAAPYGVQLARAVVSSYKQAQIAGPAVALEDLRVIAAKVVAIAGGTEQGQ